MKGIRLAPCSFVFVLFLASISLAQGGVQRTFVSGLGSDANPCSRAAPCRTFGQAMQMTNPGGEVIVLDSAGYGPVAIIGPVSIISPPGVYAGISVFSGDGITINAGNSDVVILRGLTINDQGSSGNGITFNSGGTLHVENCVVNGFSVAFGAGLYFGGPGKLEVKDSIFRTNSTGVVVFPASGVAKATLEQARFEGNTGSGLIAREGSNVTVRNSVASGNSTGFWGNNLSNSPSVNLDLTIESCIASNNSGVGVFQRSPSSGAARVRISASTITGNGTGLEDDGAPGFLLSRGNNTVVANSLDTSGTIGSFTAK